MKKIILSLVIGILMISFASAYLGSFKQNECVNIVTNLNSTSVNITNVNTPSPNSQVILTNQVMTANGNLFNFTFCNTSTIGRYTYGYCDNLGECYSNDFEVNPTGETLTSAKSSIYIFIFIASLLVLVGLLWLGLGIPSGNKRDEMTGYIIAVSNIKYLKIVFLGLAYLTIVFITYFTWMISYSFLNMTFMSDIFRFIFYFLAIATLPLFIFLTVIMIMNLVRDSKVKDMLMRGLRVE